MIPGYPKPYEGTSEALAEDDETVTIYYGPRLLKMLYYDQTPDDNFKYYQIKDMGTLGLSTERMITDLYSIGGEAMYSKANISYSEMTKGYLNGIYQQINYDYSIRASTLCILLRGNIHFPWLFDEKFDVYALYALGYRRTKFKIETNDPDFVFNVNNYYSFIDPTFPVTGKFGFGIRYYFSELLGANVEVSVGQPNVAVGINLRFSK